MLELGLVEGMRNLAIFWAFLDAFASWMRVYMFYIEKVSKMGLFWLSLFLCYLSLFFFWLSSCGKVYTFGYGFWCGSMAVIANVGVFVFLSIGIIVL